MLFRRVAWAFPVAVICSAILAAQTQPGDETGYLLPPKAIVDILDAPPVPTAIISPSRQVVALIERRSMPPLAELAQPMLRLAGFRVNPTTNGPHRTPGLVGITLKTIADGSERMVGLPPGTSQDSVAFSPDSRRLSFSVFKRNGIELWVADVATGAAKAITDATLNAVRGAPCDWLNDSSGLVCTFIAPARGSAPAPPDVSRGPNVQENDGRPAPVRTFQDLLETAHEEALFEYYFTSQLAIVDPLTGQRTPIRGPAIFDQVSPSPNDEFILLERIQRPFSRLLPAGSFPRVVEVWDRKGNVVKRLADIPLADAVPIDGVRTGPRAYRWKQSAPATLVWVEALDEGDPKNKVSHRDRVMTLAAPFAAEPTELAKTEFRFSGLSWTDQGIGLLTESDRVTRKTRTWLLHPGSREPRTLWDRSSEDAYGNPGSPITRPGPGGMILQSGDDLYLAGNGASPQGDCPFLDRLSLETLQATRLFRCQPNSYETVVMPLTDDGRLILTRYETRTEPPNYYVRDLTTNARRALTQFKDPAPDLARVEKRLLTYERKDGVQLSATLYLPPGYRQGERLPILMWAYPREFADPGAAGQVRGSPHRFTAISGASHLLLLTQGYAILDDPTMPIVGPGKTANDTYVEQLVASAEAAVNKVVELGVADRNRIGIGGHSYGAFMTANLLAHSDLFRAGIARSGAYNRTLTPFGFQNESRTFWEVPELYGRMSPFWYAHKVNEPVLLIHGEADDNSGTFPVQSERFYMALKGHGATVRYVTLPHEAHGYAARESVLHTVAEMLTWMDRWVKNAPPRATSGQ